MPFSSLLTSHGQPSKTPGQRDLEELETRIIDLESEIKERDRLLNQRDNSSMDAGPDHDGTLGRGLNSTVGMYLFAHLSGQGMLALCFFHVTNPPLVSASSSYGHSSVDPQN